MPEHCAGCGPSWQEALQQTQCSLAEASDNAWDEHHTGPLRAKASLSAGKAAHLVEAGEEAEREDLELEAAGVLGALRVGLGALGVCLLLPEGHRPVMGGVPVQPAGIDAPHILEVCLQSM